MKKRKSENPQEPKPSGYIVPLDRTMPAIPVHWQDPKPFPKSVIESLGWGEALLKGATFTAFATRLREIVEVRQTEDHHHLPGLHLMELIRKATYMGLHLDPAPPVRYGQWHMDPKNAAQATRSDLIRKATAILRRFTDRAAAAQAYGRPLLAWDTRDKDDEARLLAIADDLDGGKTAESIKADKAKDARAKGEREFARFLDRVLMHADQLARKLRLSLEPTYPFKAADMTLVKGNCKVLRRLLSPVAPVPGPYDLDALAGYEVEPITLLSFAGVSSSVREAAKWLLSLVERIDTDVTREQRPTPQLVQELEDAAALLRGSIPQESADVRRRSVYLKAVIKTLILAGAVIAPLLVITHVTTLPGTEWLRNHPKSPSLQIGVGLVVLFASLSLFVPPWRKACWSIGIFAVLLVLLALI